MPTWSISARTCCTRSLDKGETWQAISPDPHHLQEPRQRALRHPLSTVAESPRQFGLLWAGTDDGNVVESDSAGARWSNVAVACRPSAG